MVPVDVGVHAARPRRRGRVCRGTDCCSTIVTSMPPRPGRGRGLRADPARPDHDQAPAGGDHVPQAVAVVEGPQHVDAVEVGARDGQPAAARSRSPAAGGPSRGVSPSLSVAVRARGVDRRHLAPAQELDLLLGVEALGVDVDRVPLGPALQVVLGERRALVGPVRLGPDEDDAPVEALLAQGLGRLRPRQARPHDHEGRSLGHPAPPRSGGRASTLVRRRPARPILRRSSGIRSCARTAWSVPLVAITRTSTSACVRGSRRGRCGPRGRRGRAPPCASVAPPSSLACTR